MSADPLRALLELRELPARRIVGLMSGTSADGIDAAIVEVTGHGARTRVELLGFESYPIERSLRRRIWALPDGASVNICELNFLLGEAFARAAIVAAERCGLEPGQLHLVGSHGQTARHHPPRMGRGGSTLQIGEGAVIAERTGLPVICDFRVGDVAAGGQGAPLIPLVDYLLLHESEKTLATLNLGGIANITVVPPKLDDVTAFDTGPANMAIDAVARAASDGHRAFDLDGELARAGSCDEALLEELLEHPFFELPPPKSTGRELFGRDFVYPLLDRFDARLPDLMATLVRLTVESIGDAFDRFVLPEATIDRVLVSGGGVHNPALMELLERRLAPIPVLPFDAEGVDPDAKEAIAFAVLANETLFCRPGNVPNATGASGPRVLGKIVLPPLGQPVAPRPADLYPKLER